MPADNFQESGDTAEVRKVVPKMVRTLDEAVAAAGVDLKVWKVSKWECTAWQVGMKLGRKGSEEPHVEQLYRVHLKLERRLPKPVQDAADEVYRRLSKCAPKYPSPPRAPVKDPHCLVLDLHDAHFGKLSWAAETGQNSDLRLSEQVWKNAVSDLLRFTRGYEFDNVVVPVGSDFLHVDNLDRSTTNGTPQDADGRTYKIIATAELAFVWMVEQLLGFKQVSLFYLPGNHDRLLSYCLARTVQAHFRHCKNVSVDVSPTSRKYVRYHDVLLGFAHGDVEKKGSLPGLMAVERPRDWGESKYREVHTGHYHKPMKHEFRSLDTYNGVPVRTLSSLSAVDAWHYREGYVGTRRAAEAYIYSHRGYVGHFVAEARLG